MNDSKVTGQAFDAHHPPDRRLIDKCVHCGFCLPTCPTYALWGEEMDSPRGRIYLMKPALEGRVDMTPGFVRHFDACLGCMACVTACPSGVQYGPLIEATRAQIERRYPRSAGDRLFRSLLFSVVPYPAPAAIRARAAGRVPAAGSSRSLQRSGILNLLPRACERCRARAAGDGPIADGDRAGAHARGRARGA